MTLNIFIRSFWNLPKLLQANTRDSAINSATTASFHVLSNWTFTNLPTILIHKIQQKLHISYLAKPTKYFWRRPLYHLFTHFPSRRLKTTVSFAGGIFMLCPECKNLFAYFQVHFVLWKLRVSRNFNKKPSSGFFQRHAVCISDGRKALIESLLSPIAHSVMGEIQRHRFWNQLVEIKYF